MPVVAGSTPQPGRGADHGERRDRASGRRSSRTGTSVSPRRSTAAPAARTRSRFGLRSPKTTRSTAWVVARLAVPRRRAGHVPAALDRDERRRSGPARATIVTPARRSHSPAVASSRPSPTSSARSPGTTPNRSIRRDHGPRRHDAGTVGAGHEWHALVRARRGDHGPRPDLEVRVVADGRDHPVVPADGGRRRSGARRRPPWLARSRSSRRASVTSASGRRARVPPRRGRPARHARPPRRAAVQPGPAATDDQHIRLDPSRRPPDPARARPRHRPAAAPARRTSAGRRGTACAAPSVAGIDGGRTSAGSSATRGRPATAGPATRSAARARRARPAPRGPAPGTTGRSARRPPRTRTSRTGRSSTSGRGPDGTGSCATGSAVRPRAG